MSHERDGAGSGRPPGGRRRRPPPTIEGTASEVVREPMAEATPEPSPMPEPPPPPRYDRRHWIAAAIAGVIAIAVIGTALWLLSEYLNRDASLARKVDTLDAQVRGLAGKPADADAKALDDLRARVDVIDTGLRRVDDRLNRAESTL